MVEKNAEETRQRILDALGRLLAKGGFHAVGVNALARAAGVDKVLIYRYFGGLSQLLRSFAMQGGFWPGLHELAGGSLKELATLPAAAIGSRILKGHLRQLLKRDNTREIMRWELVERNELTDELARTREQQGLQLLEMMQSLPVALPPDSDFPAVAALLHAGITYLVLRAKTADVYNGVELGTEAGWKRIEAAIDELTAAYFARPVHKEQSHETP